ncbi:calcium-dependent phosphotriesterase [Abortiporus biennis]|nr:calcium-dependent phosphotriesterase [Abortiporus biennis]
MVFLTSGLVALLGLGLRSIVNVKSQDTVAGVASSQITIDTRKFNVLGIDGDFRTNASSQLFNPTNTTPPFFQAFDPAFLSVLGKNPSIRSIVSNPSFAFAHEAPIWLPSTDEVFFASNDGGPLGMSDINNNNQYAKIGLKEVASSIQAAGGDSVNISVTKLDLPDTVQMTNGGTGPFRGALLLVNSGRGPIPPSIALVDPSNPQNTTIILDNFFGRQFNSLNDVKIHRQSGKIFFTDTFYGFLNEFRPSPLLPGQVYRFDPDTGDVRVVADGFNKPNGIALSQDGKSAFVTDTGTIGGTPTDPATIYKFDIDPTTQAFLNRKVFAFTDAGIPDGIQLDSKGNVYSGCADGTQVWNPEGKLIGKFFLGTLSANMIFAGKGRLVIMGETSIFFAEIAAEGFDLSFES